MSTEIRQSELRNDNAAIMRRVAGGESFTVTVNGRSVADVVPHQRDSGRRRFVPASEAISALTATAVDSEQWSHDVREGEDELSGPDEPADPWAREAHRQLQRKVCPAGMVQSKALLGTT